MRSPSSSLENFDPQPENKLASKENPVDTQDSTVTLPECQEDSRDNSIASHISDHNSISWSEYERLMNVSTDTASETEQQNRPRIQQVCMV